MKTLGNLEKRETPHLRTYPELTAASCSEERLTFLTRVIATRMPPSHFCCITPEALAGARKTMTETANKLERSK